MKYEVMGFHLVNNRSGLKTIQEHYKKIDQLIPTLLEVKGSGKVISKNMEDKALDFFRKKDIVPMVQNYNLESDISNKLISDKKAWSVFINSILKYMSNNCYQELCLDIEGVGYSQKDTFNSFIKETTNELHKKGYSLSIAVPAKSENNKDSTWSGAYDYMELGKIVDKVIIMAYDYHWVGGPSGPIAPIFWVQDVIDFAIMEIPLEKIYLALGFYGYDWGLNTENRARGLIYNQIMNIAERHKSTVEWDPDSQSPYLRYTLDGIKHEIWFENRESISKKLNLLENFQLKGAAFWRLGQEDPEIWSILQN
ncbi:MAG: glycosyl hydrolase family 18 protein [bacterium]